MVFFFFRLYLSFLLYNRQLLSLNMKAANRHKNKNQVPEYKNLTAFKAMQKHFKKYHNQQTDYSIVLQPKEYYDIFGYQVYFLDFPQGAILVRNFNTPQTAFNISTHALNVYCYPPYRTNLNSRMELYEEKQEEAQPGKEGKAQQQLKTENKQMKIETQQQQAQNKGYIFNDKIRWANVGYQYDWTERKYPNKKTEIPQTIAQLCQRANKLYNEIKDTKKNYYPQSAIINYYSEKDYMTGHLDDAEIDQHSPIYSFSFGLSCIFLIGDNTKQTKPVAVRLNSGDLFIMSGQSRQAYHGVPRIINDSFALPKQIITGHKENWVNKPQNVLNYLAHHRININVRQVYPTED